MQIDTPLLCCSCSEECTSLGKHPDRRPNQSHLRNCETLRTICMCPHRCGANIWSWFVKRSSRCHNIFHLRVVERLRTQRVQSDLDTVEELCCFNIVFMFIFTYKLQGYLLVSPQPGWWVAFLTLLPNWQILSSWWWCRSAYFFFFVFFDIIYYFTLFPVLLCNLKFLLNPAFALGSLLLPCLLHSF